MALRGGPLGSSSAAVSVPGWRPEDFHRFETNFLQAGVVTGLAVSERGAGANMSVDVSAGLALISVTTTLLSPDYTFKTWLSSDAVVNVPVPTADATNPRKDRIVASFDMTVDPNGSASNIVSIELIEGTPAGSPSAPATPSNAISLAIVDVPASDTAIGNAQITDDRTFVKLGASVLADVLRATFQTDLASTTNAKGASMVGVEDAAGDFTGDNVEEVLAELNDKIGTFEKPVYIAISDSGTIGTSSTTETEFDTHTYTIPADDLVANVAYVVEGIVSYASGAGYVRLGIRLGSTTIAQNGYAANDGTVEVPFRAIVLGTAAAGAAVSVKGQVALGGFNQERAGTGAQNVATNGTLALKITNQFDTSNGSNSATLKSLVVRKISTSAFAA